MTKWLYVHKSWSYVSGAVPSDWIVYDTATGALYYDSNGATAGGQTQFAALAGAPALSVTDFFVV